MSAIGDYIHYTAKGYNMHGTTLKGKREIFNFQIQKNNINKRLKFSGMQKKHEYQDALNKILSNKDTSDSQVQDIQSYIETQLNSKYLETMGKINWSTGNVSANIARGKEISTNAIRTTGSQQKVLVSSIVSRIRALEAARNNIVNAKDRNELSKKITTIYRDLSAILADGKRLQEVTNLRLKGNLVGQYKPISIAEGSAGYNLITNINALVKQYGVAPAINLQKGDLFEYAAALAPAIGKVNAQNVLYETLSSGVVGGTRSNVEINFGEFFTDRLNLNSLVMSHYTINENGTAVSWGSSQEKIDINVNWQGQIIPMSAKNVNLKSGYGVHILSGSSLLYLIQDEPSNFINHYLNIIAAHPDGKVNANIVEAHEAMKYTLLYKALTGETYKRKGASIFLVNDNSQEGGVRIYEMKDLIEKASMNIDAFVSFEPTLESIKLENKWASNYGDRIANVLSSVHAQKISVALNPSLLN